MNKTFIVLVSLICIIGLLAAGCAPNTAGNPAPTSEPEVLPAPTSIPEASPTPSEAVEPAGKSEFSVIVGENSISLMDWDNEVDLGFLGTPISENLRTLDETSDTFAGSHVKNVEYDGLELELFSPKDNGVSFWIKEITITNGKYKTPEEIGVGSSIGILMEKYPEIQQVPDGRTDPDNCAYIHTNVNEFSNMVFEIKDGQIISVKLYKEMP